MSSVISSKPISKQYSEGWERTFGKNKPVAINRGVIRSQKFLSSKMGKKLPNFIKNDPWFRENEHVRKIWPQIGLPNDYVRKAYNDPDFGMCDLVFSSTGVRGLWDIATMSMRGVLSCMHWENPHSKCMGLAVVDPFTAVIYLTNNKKTPYGRSIVKRSFVNLGVCNYDNYSQAVSDRWKPCICIGRPYAKTDNTDPMKYVNKCSNSAHIMELFTSYIGSKTKLPIRGSYLIPRHPSVNEFLNRTSLYDLSTGHSYANCGPFAERLLNELKYPHAELPAQTPA